MPRRRTCAPASIRRAVLPFHVYLSRSPALCKHCTILWADVDTGTSLMQLCVSVCLRASARVRFLYRHFPTRVTCPRTPDATHIPRYTYGAAKNARLRENFSKDFVRFGIARLSYSLPNPYIASPSAASFDGSNFFFLFVPVPSFSPANVNIRSREGMHDLSAVPVWWFLQRT